MDKSFQLSPIHLTVISYLILILFGTFLLMLPISTVGEHPISLIDSFFTATSAVCVTGLVIHNTGAYFSQFGQGVILALFQLGGLGIMTLYASLPVLLGRQMKMAQRKAFSELFDAQNYSALKRILVSIIKYTIVIEFIGASILALKFHWDGMPWGQAIYFGAFHAISAFCNAGFIVFPEGMEAYSGDPVVNLTIMGLIILGGLGFIVLHELFSRERRKQVSSHTRLVLAMTALLIFVPSFIVFQVEFFNGFSGMGFFEKILSSFFQVITTRTAGFNTVDLNSLHSMTIFLFCILMFVGAAPGGTGGGVKVTTVGLLSLSMKAIFKRNAEIECFKKSVLPEVITRSIAIIAISFSVITLFMMALMLTEDALFKDVFFEVISAFGTVGLSLGLTPKLTFVGKILVSLLMFIGRIGSLSLVFVLSSEAKSSKYHYSPGKFIVG